MLDHSILLFQSSWSLNPSLPKLLIARSFSSKALNHLIYTRVQRTKWPPRLLGVIDMLIFVDQTLPWQLIPWSTLKKWQLDRLVAYICYKANSNVCHTAAILDVAHGKRSAASSQPQCCINLLSTESFFALHYIIIILTAHPMTSLPLVTTPI